MSDMGNDRDFDSLESFLTLLPAIEAPLIHGHDQSGLWWVKFSIDIENSLAWHVVQELAHVLNYLSLNERLPTSFKPVSPPPYMNGGPSEYLSWVIECSDKKMKPGTVAKWLESRLPQPVNDLTQWATE